MDNAIRWIVLLSILLGTSLSLGSYEDQVHTISLRSNPLDEFSDEKETSGKIFQLGSSTLENLQHEMSMNQINALEKQNSELMIMIKHLETEKQNILKDLYNNSMAMQRKLKRIELECPDYAIRRNRTQVDIVENYKKLNALSDETKIMSSACRYNISVVTAFLDWGFDVHSQLSYYDNITWSCLHIAAANNDEQLIKILLERSANISVRNNELSTPLMIASNFGTLEAVKLLVERGADVKERGRDNDTSLMYALYGITHYAIVNLLVEKGSDIKHRNNDGVTPLIIAARRGSYELVKYLLTRGAHMNETDNKGRTTTWYALGNRLGNGIFQETDFLFDKNVDVDMQDNEGVTPLMFAARSFYKLDIVKVLVKKGADVNKANFKNKTVLMYAAENHSFSTLKYLVELGVNINAKDNEGRTAFILASIHYYYSFYDLQVVTYLVENNAEINARDKYNKTALGYVKDKDAFLLVPYLISIGATE